MLRTFNGRLFYYWKYRNGQNETTLEFFSKETVLFKHENVVIGLFKAQIESQFVIFGWGSIYYSSLHEAK